jgi:hypothetical protein
MIQLFIYLDKSNIFNTPPTVEMTSPHDIDI